MNECPTYKHVTCTVSNRHQSAAFIFNLCSCYFAKIPQTKVAAGATASPQLLQHYYYYYYYNVELTEQSSCRDCTHPEPSLRTQHPVWFSFCRSCNIASMTFSSRRMHGEYLAPRWIRSAWHTFTQQATLHSVRPSVCVFLCVCLSVFARLSDCLSLSLSPTLSVCDCL